MTSLAVTPAPALTPELPGDSPGAAGKWPRDLDSNPSPAADGP